MWEIRFFLFVSHTWLHQIIGDGPILLMFIREKKDLHIVVTYLIILAI